MSRYWWAASQANQPPNDDPMTVNEGLRLAAGFFVLLSVGLGYFVHPAWFLFTVFVGLNLTQSSFTLFCPLEMILRRVVKRETPVEAAS